MIFGVFLKNRKRRENASDGTVAIVRQGRLLCKKIKQIKDRTMLQRLIDIETLGQEDKKTLVHVIDSLLRDARARKTYATQA
jgi:hypothetical protein